MVVNQKSEVTDAGMKLQVIAGKRLSK